jgi:hypothetical protein
MENANFIPIVSKADGGKLQFLGLWTTQGWIDTPNVDQLTTKLLQVQVGSFFEPLLRSLQSRPSRHVKNAFVDVGNGCGIDGGVFIMFDQNKAPCELLAGPDINSAYLLLKHPREHFDYLILCGVSDPRVEQAPKGLRKVQRKGWKFW